MKNNLIDIFEIENNPFVTITNDGLNLDLMDRKVFVPRIHKLEKEKAIKIISESLHNHISFKILCLNFRNGDCAIIAYEPNQFDNILNIKPLWLN